VSQDRLKKTVGLIFLSFVFIPFPFWQLMQSGVSFFIFNDFRIVHFIFYYLSIWVASFVLLGSIYQIFKVLRIPRIDYVFISLVFAYTLSNILNIQLKLNKLSYILFFGSFLIILYFISQKYKINLAGLSQYILFPLVFTFFIFFASPLKEILIESRGVQVQGDWDAKNLDVYFLIIDEVPLGPLLDAQTSEIDSSLFPNFSNFQKQSTWYRNAKALASNTLHAVPTLQTGLHPTGATATAENYPNSIFTALANKVEFKVFEPYTRVCPIRLCGRPEISKINLNINSLNEFNLDENYIILKDTQAIFLNSFLPPSLAKFFAPPLSDRWQDFYNIRTDLESRKSASILSDQDKLEWKKVPGNLRTELPGIIQEIENRKGPQFWFMHWVPPHAADTLPDGSKYSFKLPYQMDLASENKHLNLLRRQQFILQMQYADLLLGELVDKLKIIDNYDDSMVIVTTDHGMHFGNGERRGKEFNSGSDKEFRIDNYYKLFDPVSIPLMIKYPQQKTGIILDTEVNTSDVPVTILDMYNFKKPITWPQTNGQVLYANNYVEKGLFWHLYGNYLDTMDEIGRKITFKDALNNSTKHINQNIKKDEYYVFKQGDDGDLFLKESKFAMQSGRKAINVEIMTDLDKVLDSKKVWLFEAYVSEKIKVERDANVLISIDGAICGSGPIYVDTVGKIRVEALISDACELVNNSIIEVFS